MDNIKYQLFNALKELAKAYGKENIGQDRLEIYTKFLSEELTVLELRNSFSKILTTCKFFPSIAEIVELARPKKDVVDEAVLIANKVLECARSFSFTNINGAKEFLGEHFTIAERYGWRGLIELENSDVPTARAQLRELAKAHINHRAKNEPSDHLQLRTAKETGSLLSPLSNTLTMIKGE